LLELFEKLQIPLGKVVVTDTITFKYVVH